MSKILFTLIMLFSFSELHGQWKPANNGMPYGAPTRMANANSQGIFAMVDEELFVSFDKGANWQRKGAFDYSTSISSNENTAVLGSAKVFFVSNNNGNTWLRTGTFDDFIFSVGVSPQGTFFVSTGKAIFRSLDKGQSWQPINNGLPSGTSFKKINFVGLWVYGHTTNNFLYRSDNNGETWSNGINTDGIVTQFSAYGNKMLMSTQWGLLGSINGLLSVTQLSPTYPANPVAMEVGTNLMCVLAYNGELFISADEGVTWISRKPAEFYGKYFFSLALDGPSILVGTINGVFKSDDNGVTWSSINQGISKVQVYNFDYAGGSLVTSTNKGILSSSDLGENWVNISSNILDRRVRWVIQINGKVFAAAITNSSLSGGSDAKGGLFVLESTGVWREVLLSPNTSEVFMLHKNGNHLFACTEKGLFKSVDTGDTWTNILPNSVSAISARGDTIVAQTGSGLSYPIIKLSKDGGSTWTFSNLNVAASGFVIRGKEIWAIQGRVLASPDFGFTWNSRPPFTFPVNTLTSKGDLLLLGSTEYGLVWSRNDEMQSLNSNLGLPFQPSKTAISNICIAGDFVFIGFGSSGVWKRPLAELLSDGSVITNIPQRSKENKLRVYPNPTTGRVSISFADQQVNRQVTLSDLLGRIVTDFASTQSEIEIDLSHLNSGIYLIKADGYLETRLVKK